MNFFDAAGRRFRRTFGNAIVFLTTVSVFLTILKVNNDVAKLSDQTSQAVKVDARAFGHGVETIVTSMEKKEDAFDLYLHNQYGRAINGERSAGGDDREWRTATLSRNSTRVVNKDGSVGRETTGSESAAVLGVGIGYNLAVYRSFVGSLRFSGFRGHIILGVAPDVDKRTRRYLIRMNVTVKTLKWVNCTYFGHEKVNDEVHIDSSTCAYPYDGLKLRWSRYPLAADWLRECVSCTGPVLFTDVRDVFFQKDPFRRDRGGELIVKGLQVFEEHPGLDTTNWITEWPIRECKGVRYEKPMLCSGTTIGTKDSMLRYLDIVYMEMKEWLSDPKCRFNTNADDQAVHNYLYYSGRLALANATAIPHRTGIVNTVGFEGAKIREAHEEKRRAMGDKEPLSEPFDGADLERNRWIGESYNLTDSEGFFTSLDGSRSCVVHQYDRLGNPFTGMWLERQGFMMEMTHGNIDSLKTSPLQKQLGNSFHREAAPTSTRISKNFGYDIGIDSFVFANGTVWDEKVDVDKEAQRCRRYGYGYDGRHSRRRIFMGGLIADESWHVLQAVAAESYDIYHSLVFVESNTTQTGHKRYFRFANGSVDLARLSGGMFGPKSAVTVDKYIEKDQAHDLLTREHMQRELISRRWKEDGMKPDDVGLLADADETFTRDFLRAAQICDIPQFRPGQDCRAPKLVAATVVFEGGPDCIAQERLWFHPDMVIGECIHNIGHAGTHPFAKRVFREVHGGRASGYGGNGQNDYGDLPNSTMLPLLNMADFRTYDGGQQVRLEPKSNFWEAARKASGQPTAYTGYHFHNFFNGTEDIRWKYQTYGHPDDQAFQKPLEKIHQDLSFMSNCAMNRSSSKELDGHSRVNGGLDTMVGPWPIFFQSRKYRKQRQSEMRKMIEEDEKKYRTN